MLPIDESLKRYDHNDIEINSLGIEWCNTASLLFAYKLRSHYGEIPLPEVVIEDDLTLCFSWDCHGDPVVIRLDDTMWDFVKKPLEVQ